MAKLFNFEVHTPYRPFFKDAVEAISLTLSDGEIGVYAGHSAFTAPALTSVLRIKDKNGVWKEAFASEGILEVKEHKTVLVIDAAEWSEEIDYDRAIAARTQAMEVLESGIFKFEIDRARASLKRAETRILVYERSRRQGGPALADMEKG
ncbi:MAG: ATP synthase F1 subunit epsilon [Spirochaetaceae bacterium]|jgi:F-type H+-transporting ATPase subunit epsilon|nr:ATP synthase F1 subunit epsilon [Spirochaetaceae bacterium]